MKRLCAVLVGLLIVGWLAPARAQNGNELLTVTDLLKIQELGSVTASPDGRFVAYTVRSIVEQPEQAGAYSYRSHLFVIPVAEGGEPRPLTFDDRTAAQPAWHPDSDRLAFVREVDGKSQIFILPIYGGESRQLTDFEHGASHPLWSPDGKRLLFTATLSEKTLAEMTGTAPHWSDERPGRLRDDVYNVEPDPDGSLGEVRAWLEANSEDGDPRVFTRLDLHGEHDLEARPRYRHYFVIDTNRDDAEPKLLTSGFYSYDDATWLPDGSQILVSGPPEDGAHPDHERDRNLYLVDADGGRLNLMLDVEGYALSGPLISPDANLISFLARDLDDPGYTQTELGLFALNGQMPPELLTLGFDRSLGQVKWSFDNWYLYFVAASEGGFPLYRLPVFEGRPAQPSAVEDDIPLGDTLAADTMGRARGVFARDEIVERRPDVERLTSPEHGIRSYDITAATAYYVLTEALNPYEFYAANMDFRSQRRLTDHNASWLANKRLSVPDADVLRRDTLRIPYWVMRPPFYERGRMYPVLLEIHGGPAAMWGPGEATMWLEFQLMAAKGYAIVYSNPRGSGGYGRAYKALNYQDWGEGPAGDVLAVATEAVRRNRWMDPERQVITGGSYAGYLTAWIVGHDDRFKAAVAQRGVYDLSTFFGEGNAWRLVPYHFGGYPWEDDARDVLASNSPLTYVEQIRTPLLIIHSDNDRRTGTVQSEVLYKSLKALERPVEYVRYPRAGHDLSRTGAPKQRIDRLLRIYEFMERYVGPTESPASSE